MNWNNKIDFIQILHLESWIKNFKK